ncbi:hypothetical protein HMPREF0971_01318 [Segatella oris F0302]|uniref:DUF5675 domain-containing protein n=2 Tax=Segatella oris TaxID=28135 RepID=D1QQR7_9BACT|nr:hypothetical protein HMPREF0971_01318 [Segatella oris F0302]
MLMKINIKRIARKTDYTIGHLYVGGQYFCDTLEPADCGLTKETPLRDIQLAKARGRVAIPMGCYRVLITKSPRFGCWLPLVYGVRGFKGIRIHAGNRPGDTSGCILVGWNRRVGELMNSRTALHLLMQKMTEALGRGERVEVEIE